MSLDIGPHVLHGIRYAGRVWYRGSRPTHIAPGHPTMDPANFVLHPVVIKCTTSPLSGSSTSPAGSSSTTNQLDAPPLRNVALYANIMADVSPTASPAGLPEGSYIQLVIPIAHNADPPAETHKVIAISLLYIL